MRGNSHKTVIGVVRDHVDLWRKQQGLTLQVAAAEMVAVYFDRRFDRVWPIDFHQGGDAYAAMKANSERIWRWLDDQTKDSTLLPANFIQVVLLTLPENIRLACVAELLSPLSMAPTLLVPVEVRDSHAHLLASVALESGEAVSAMAMLADGWTSDELARAQTELVQSIAASKKALHFVEQQMGGVRAPA